MIKQTDNITLNILLQYIVHKHMLTNYKKF